MVGLTEDMPATAAMAAKVFPWLAERIDWKEAVDDEAHIPSDSTTLYKNCTLPHKSHWDLPDHPDDCNSSYEYERINDNDLDLL
jgi:hypothetical protein